MYREAAQFVFSRMPNRVSIVSSSILSAIAGRFGHYHATVRTRGSTLWMNPLMGVYWALLLEAVAGQCLYLDGVSNTESYY